MKGPVTLSLAQGIMHDVFISSIVRGGEYTLHFSLDSVHDKTSVIYYSFSVEINMFSSDFCTEWLYKLIGSLIKLW